ncbi:hypothetical protein RclHR1_13960005 [Rhizophagus clarus]|uniref:Uncharacterized protein n=1 Tax=Rhizophagus clarus TaxID=94130 RepID=A0A2Z6QD72_9GLOM|nr:hypothetical protein RclHR1_13960005 [Rhizophagus clarus]
MGFKARLQGKRALVQLSAVFDWALMVNNIFTKYTKNERLSDLEIKKLVEEFEPITKIFKDAYDKWTWEYTADQLRILDKGRNSWTDEDPNYNDIIRELKVEETKHTSITKLSLRSVPISIKENPQIAIRLQAPNGKYLSFEKQKNRILKYSDGNRDSEKFILELKKQHDAYKATVYLKIWFNVFCTITHDGQLEAKEDGQLKEVIVN